MKKLLIFLFLYLSCYNLNATEDYYTFTSDLDQQRFYTLTTELRCLVCQNQNLAESNASLATDLRNQIYKKITQGQSNEQIINYLVARYGDFIMYRPPIKIYTLCLWFGPLFILLFGIIYLIYYLKRNNPTKLLNRDK